MRPALLAAIVFLSALVFAGGAAASDGDAAMTLTSHRAHATAVAVARLDPSDDPYAVVCRLDDGSFTLVMLDVPSDYVAPPDGLPCFSGT